MFVHFEYAVLLTGYIELDGPKHGSRVLRTYPDGVQGECENKYGNFLYSLFSGSIGVVLYHSIFGDPPPEILECPLEEGVWEYYFVHTVGLDPDHVCSRQAFVRILLLEVFLVWGSPYQWVI